MAHTIDQFKADMVSFGVSQSAVYTWAAVHNEPPRRSPSRPHRPYQPRGQVSTAALRVWGTPQTPKRARATVAPPEPSKRISYAIAVPLVGVGIVLAGVAIYSPQSAVPPAVAVPDITALKAPIVPAADTLDLAATNPVPAIAKATAWALPAAQPTSTITTPPMRDVRPQVGTTAPSIAPLPAILGHEPVIAQRPTVAMRPDAPAQVTLTPDIEPFACQSCLPLAPAFDGITLMVFASGTEPDGLLAGLAPKDIVISAPAITPENNQVRFYRADDAEQAAFLARTYNAALVDLTWFAPDQISPRIDLFLASKS